MTEFRLSPPRHEWMRCLGRGQRGAASHLWEAGVRAALREGSGAAEGGCQITAASWVCLREEQLGACPAPFLLSAALGDRLQLSEPVREE